MWFGVGGVDEQAQIFSHCPVALNCNLSFHFPLCLKHNCARARRMDSVWEDDPDSYKLEFVFRDSKNVASCRVSLRLVTSSRVCVVAAGLGPGPLSIDFALCLETVFPLKNERDMKVGKPVRFAGQTHPRQPQAFLGTALTKDSAPPCT